jgi:hypothetical protein
LPFLAQDIVYDPATHSSILEIKNHVDVEKNFEFQHITSNKIEKVIDKINIEKPLGLLFVLLNGSFVLCNGVI